MAFGDIKRRSFNASGSLRSAFGGDWNSRDWLHVDDSGHARPEPSSVMVCRTNDAGWLSNVPVNCRSKWPHDACSKLRSMPTISAMPQRPLQFAVPSGASQFPDISRSRRADSSTRKRGSCSCAVSVLHPAWPNGLLHEVIVRHVADMRFHQATRHPSRPDCISSGQGFSHSRRRGLRENSPVRCNSQLQRPYFHIFPSLFAGQK